MDIFRIFLLAFLPGIFSISLTTGSYTDYLYHKYGKPIKDKYINRNPKIEGPLWKRPFRLNYEERYPISAKRRKRFLFFLWLTRLNYIFTCILAIILTICMIFGISSYDTLESIAILKILFIDGFCISCCIPFGFIVHIFIFIFDVITDTGSSSGHSGEYIDIWWG